MKKSKWKKYWKTMYDHATENGQMYWDEVRKTNELKQLVKDLTATLREKNILIERMGTTCNTLVGDVNKLNIQLQTSKFQYEECRNIRNNYSSKIYDAAFLLLKISNFSYNEFKNWRKEYRKSVSLSGVL